MGEQIDQAIATKGASLNFDRMGRSTSGFTGPLVDPVRFGQSRLRSQGTGVPQKKPLGFFGRWVDTGAAVMRGLGPGMVHVADDVTNAGAMLLDAAGVDALVPGKGGGFGIDRTYTRYDGTSYSAPEGDPGWRLTVPGANGKDVEIPFLSDVVRSYLNTSTRWKDPVAAAKSWINDPNTVVEDVVNIASVLPGVKAASSGLARTTSAIEGSAARAGVAEGLTSSVAGKSVKLAEGAARLEERFGLGPNMRRATTKGVEAFKTTDFAKTLSQSDTLKRLSRTVPNTRSFKARRTAVELSNEFQITMSNARADLLKGQTTAAETLASQDAMKLLDGGMPHTKVGKEARKATDVYLQTLSKGTNKEDLLLLSSRLKEAYDSIVDTDPERAILLSHARAELAARAAGIPLEEALPLTSWAYHGVVGTENGSDLLRLVKSIPEEAVGADPVLSTLRQPFTPRNMAEEALLRGELAAAKDSALLRLSRVLDDGKRELNPSELAILEQADNGGGLLSSQRLGAYQAALDLDPTLGGGVAPEIRHLLSATADAAGAMHGKNLQDLLKVSGGDASKLEILRQGMLGPEDFTTMLTKEKIGYRPAAPSKSPVPLQTPVRYSAEELAKLNRLQSLVEEGRGSLPPVEYVDAAIRKIESKLERNRWTAAARRGKPRLEEPTLWKHPTHDTQLNKTIEAARKNNRGLDGALADLKATKRRLELRESKAGIAQARNLQAAQGVAKPKAEVFRAQARWKGLWEKTTPQAPVRKIVKTVHEEGPMTAAQRAKSPQLLSTVSAQSRPVMVRQALAPVVERLRGMPGMEDLVSSLDSEVTDTLNQLIDKGAHPSVVPLLAESPDKSAVRSGPKVSGATRQISDIAGDSRKHLFNPESNAFPTMPTNFVVETDPYILLDRSNAAIVQQVFEQKMWKAMHDQFGMSFEDVLKELPSEQAAALRRSVDPEKGVPQHVAAQLSELGYNRLSKDLTTGDWLGASEKRWIPREVDNIYTKQMQPFFFDDFAKHWIDPVANTMKIGMLVTSAKWYMGNFLTGFLMQAAGGASPLTMGGNMSAARAIASTMHLVDDNPVAWQTYVGGLKEAFPKQLGKVPDEVLRRDLLDHVLEGAASRIETMPRSTAYTELVRNHPQLHGTVNALAKHPKRLYALGAAIDQTHRLAFYIDQVTTATHGVGGGRLKSVMVSPANLEAMSRGLELDPEFYKAQMKLAKQGKRIDLTVEQAAAHGVLKTGEFLGNMGRMGKVERQAIKRIAWFYPWIKKTMQLSASMLKPENLGRTLFGMNLFGIHRQLGKDTEELFLPEYMKGTLKLPYTVEGVPQYFDVNALVNPFSANPVGEGDISLAQVTSAANPVAQWGWGKATGTSPLNLQPYTNAYGEKGVAAAPSLPQTLQFTLPHSRRIARTADELSGDWTARYPDRSPNMKPGADQGKTLGTTWLSALLPIQAFNLQEAQRRQQERDASAQSRKAKVDAQIRLAPKYQG